MKDGVPTRQFPRLQENDGRIRIRLDDLVSCLVKQPHLDVCGTGVFDQIVMHVGTA